MTRTTLRQIKFAFTDTAEIAPWISPVIYRYTEKPKPLAESEDDVERKHYFTFTFNGDLEFDKDSQVQVGFTGRHALPGLRLESAEEGPWFDLIYRDGEELKPEPLFPKDEGNPRVQKWKSDPDDTSWGWFTVEVADTILSADLQDFQVKNACCSVRSLSSRNLFLLCLSLPSASLPLWLPSHGGRESVGRREEGGKRRVLGRRRRRRLTTPFQISPRHACVDVSDPHASFAHLCQQSCYLLSCH